MVESGVLVREKIAGGDVVRLKKGAVVFSSNPQHPPIGKIVTVRRIVTLRHIELGGVILNNAVDAETENLVVCWYGQGHYLYWTAATGVERVTPCGRAV